MRGVRIGVGFLVMGFLAGCAGGQARQDMARLQSHVSLLDDRVTQLERAGVVGGPTASLSEMQAVTETAGGGTFEPAAHASAAGKGTAKASSNKPATREIQQALKNAGFYQGSLDGKMGPQTRDAIKEFQRVHGLKDDGVAGKQTWAKLQAYAGLSSGSTSAEVLK